MDATAIVQLPSNSTVNVSNFFRESNGVFASLNEVPRDLLEIVLYHAGALEQARLRRLCKYWNAMILTPALRKDLTICFADLSAPPGGLEFECFEPSDWRRTFYSLNRLVTSSTDFITYCHPGTRLKSDVLTLVHVSRCGEHVVLPLVQQHNTQIQGVTVADFPCHFREIWTNFYASSMYTGTLSPPMFSTCHLIRCPVTWSDRWCYPSVSGRGRFEVRLTVYATGVVRCETNPAGVVRKLIGQPETPILDGIELRKFIGNISTQQAEAVTGIIRCCEAENRELPMINWNQVNVFTQLLLQLIMHPDPTDEAFLKGDHNSILVSVALEQRERLCTVTRKCEWNGRSHADDPVVTRKIPLKKSIDV